MNLHTTRRLGRRHLAAAVITAALVVVPACGSSGSTTASDGTGTTVASGGSTTTTGGHDHTVSGASFGVAQVELTQTMRLLWAQHMEWTYETVTAYITDPTSDLTAASLDRLLRNQKDIGDAVGAYFGDDAGAATTKLLTEHIQGAVPVLDAAKAGDSAALDKAVNDWYANSKEIGEAIAALNPDNWNEADVVDMLHAHIEQTVAYAGDQITGDYAQSIVDYDKAKHHMLELADVMAEGIVAKFPDEFTDAKTVTASQLELSNTLRELWHEHMEWTYATVTAYVADPKSDLTAASLDRLLRNQKDLGDAIGVYFGDDAGVKAGELLTDHIEGAVPVLDAAMAGDSAALDKAVNDWYANSKEIADAIAGLNPENWPVDTVEAMMHDHIEQTVAYAGDQISGDDAQSIVDYEKAQHHMLELADVLADGIVAKFPAKFTD